MKYTICSPAVGVEGGARARRSSIVFRASAPTSRRLISIEYITASRLSLSSDYFALILLMTVWFRMLSFWTQSKNVLSDCLTSMYELSHECMWAYQPVPWWSHGCIGSIRVCCMIISGYVVISACHIIISWVLNRPACLMIISRVYVLNHKGNCEYLLLIQSSFQFMRQAGICTYTHERILRQAGETGW